MTTDPVETSSRYWCEHCRDHFPAKHYGVNGKHKIGVEYGPVGAREAARDRGRCGDAMRIITEAELRDALSESQDVAKSRAFAFETMEALEHWLVTPERTRREWGGDAYIADMLSDLREALNDWPKPITREQL